MHNFAVDDFAKNVESGWIGKIQGFETGTVQVDDTRSYEETTAKMVGVDVLSHSILGRTAEESLSEDDIQFHDVKDLVPV